MSSRKLLIREVFEKIKKGSTKDTKSGWADELSDDLEKKVKFTISSKTLSRYYDSFVAETKEETGIENLILNKLSEYLGYKDFADFSRTFVKNDEKANKTTVKIKVDEDEESISEKFSHLNINITNEQHFNMPEFMKKNGLGIMEMVLLVCLVTGNVVFSNNKKIGNGSSFPLGFMSGVQPATDKKYMYWDGERYIATDSSFIRPGLEVRAMNEHQFLHFRKITRKDTLTDTNAIGRTWYSKFYGNVEFFTDDGIDPENGRELKRSTSIIIYKYAGKSKDSVEAEE